MLQKIKLIFAIVMILNTFAISEPDSLNYLIKNVDGASELLSKTTNIETKKILINILDSYLNYKTFKEKYNEKIKDYDDKNLNTLNSYATMNIVWNLVSIENFELERETINFFMQKTDDKEFAIRIYRLYLEIK